MKASFHRVLGATLGASGLVRFAEWLDRGKSNILRVLIYHRILETADFDWGNNPNVISAHPDDFDNQIGYLARHYRPIGAGELITALRESAPLPPRSVLVTFDDGYDDFRAYAWPVLLRYAVPAVLFVPTAFPGSGRHFWWDVVHETLARTARGEVVLPGIGAFAVGTSRQRSLAVKCLVNRLTGLHPQRIDTIVDRLREQTGSPALGSAPTLSWGDLRAMVREGLTVASHTRTHPAMPSLTVDELIDEIEGGRLDLERELGAAPPLFSYPHGQSDPRALPVLRAQGIVASFTAFVREPSVNVLHRSNPMLLRRDGVNGTASLPEFRLSLTLLSAGVRR